ncbi:MAG: hypothetical protein LLG42_15095 [Chloroflexi bacterium]|nr:hypothetical protein [Chloroflexota bacterium]
MFGRRRRRKSLGCFAALVIYAGLWVINFLLLGRIVPHLLPSLDFETRSNIVFACATVIPMLIIIVFRFRRIIKQTLPDYSNAEE